MPPSKGPGGFEARRALAMAREAAQLTPMEPDEPDTAPDPYAGRPAYTVCCPASTTPRQHPGTVLSR
ncbi:hypothetical protein GCM10010232_65310 [Streptomyces amakusaensis]